MDSADSMEAAPQGVFVAGQRVGGGRFELIRCLGRGGMGVVWLAQDHQLREPVALKFLAAEIQSDPDALEDLRRETQRCRKLSHPNIIRIHDLHELPGEPMFLSMEYVDGSNLTDLRNHQLSEVLPWEQVRPLVEQLCDALDYAHGEQVIHRDLKPGNIMLDRQNRLKLADFGIAAFLHDGDHALARHHIRCGTLVYMSPQQMEGLPPSVSDDIYSLGATLYELLTSTPPFSKGDLLELVPKARPTSIAERLRELQINNEVPKEEAAMVMACLAKEPTKRPASAWAVAEWVGIKIKRRPKPSAAVPEVKEFTTVEAGPGTSTADVGEEFGQYKMRRNLLRIGLLVVGVGIVGLSGGYWWMRHTKPSGEPSSTSPPARTVAETAIETGISTNANTASNPGTNSLANSKSSNGISVKGDAHRILVQADGSVLLSGCTVPPGEEEGLLLMRFWPNNTPDTNYNPRIKGNINAMLQQPDGKLLIGGDFTAIDGEPCNTIGRLLPDGKRDPGFNPGEGGNHEIRCLCLQPDGKILIGGDFTTFNKEKRVRYARLNPNGSVDDTFRPRTVDATVFTLAVQPDGKILFGGNFTKLGTLAHNRLIRLHPDSTIDGRFHIRPTSEDPIRSAVVLPSGKILVGGDFTKFQGEARSGLVRILPDGKLDESFPPLSDPTAKVHEILVQADQSIIITGEFNLSPQKGPLLRIAQLRPDGTLNLNKNMNLALPVEGIALARLNAAGQLISQGVLTSFFPASRTNLTGPNPPH